MTAAIYLLMIRAGDEIPLIGRILKVAIDFDELVINGATSADALKLLTKRTGYYDPNIMVALKSVTMSEGKGYVLKSIPIEDIKPGMIVAENIIDKDGQFLLGKGNEITNILLFRLGNFSNIKKVDANIKVFVPMNL